LPLEFEWREQSVFIDLPGVELGNERGLAAIEKTASAFGMPAVHLVLNAAYESAHLLDQVRFFSKLGISDLILTHLDEESRWGKIWNLVLGTNYGIRFLSAGQNIPGEFIPASADVILSRQFR
jgi:flagellar biosynthesis GTPase FlhF